MPLGNDNEVCKTEFKEAMRARLEAETPGSGANVDRPDVDPNFGALGTAVHHILTLDATWDSDAAADPAFWAWVTALAAWVTGVRAAVQAWTPVQPAEQALRTAILALPAPPPAPTSLHTEVS